MNQILKVIIQVPDNLKTGSFKELYRNSIPLDDGLCFDYQALIKGLKLLYPKNNVIINLSLM